MKDSKQFASQYRMLLEDRYSYHKTAGRSYLRPMVPVSGRRLGMVTARPILDVLQDTFVVLVVGK